MFLITHLLRLSVRYPRVVIAVVGAITVTALVFIPRIQLRLNGKQWQDCNSKELILNIAKTMSYISKHMTLLPGDVIFTGTSGTTTAMKPGDTVEVEIEGVGVLKNKVTAAK